MIWTNAPCYKAAMYVIHYLNKYFNTINSINLINEIKQFPCENYLFLASLNIPDMIMHMNYLI